MMKLKMALNNFKFELHLKMFLVKVFFYILTRNIKATIKLQKYKSYTQSLQKKYESGKISKEEYKELMTKKAKECMAWYDALTEKAQKDIGNFIMK